MDEIVYYAEIEFQQKKDLDLQQLEEFEDKILEAQEHLPEEEWIIDEDRMVLDDEDGVAYMVSVDFDSVKQLKDKLIPFLKKNVDDKLFDVSIHIYKSEYLEVIEGL
jgi:anthranilate/para-aminobenzoate synthase component I